MGRGAYIADWLNDEGGGLELGFELDEYIEELDDPPNPVEV